MERPIYAGRHLSRRKLKPSRKQEEEEEEEYEYGNEDEDEKGWRRAGHG